MQFTLAEASKVLDPPLSEHQLRLLIAALDWQPDGVRRNGHVGRPSLSAYTYDYRQITRLHKALLPFLRGPSVQ